MSIKRFKKPLPTLPKKDQYEIEMFLKPKAPIIRFNVCHPKEDIDKEAPQPQFPIVVKHDAPTYFPPLHADFSSYTIETSEFSLFPNATPILLKPLQLGDDVPKPPELEPKEETNIPDSQVEEIKKESTVEETDCDPSSPVAKNNDIIIVLDSDSENSAEEFDSDFDVNMQRIDGTQFPHPIIISFKDLKCLKQRKKWINDAVINSYLSFIMLNSANDEHIGFTNTFFYQKLINDGPESVKKWEGIDMDDIGNYEHFLIPCERRSHWTLVDIMFKKKTLRILDSAYYRQNYVAGKINEFIVSTGRKKFKIEYPKCPKQRNFYDCGAYILKFAWLVINNQSLGGFNQKDIMNWKKKIFKDLIVFAK